MPFAEGRAALFDHTLLLLRFRKEAIGPRRRFRLSGLLVLFLVSGGLTAPEAGAADGDSVWARKFGDTAGDVGSAIAVDSDGNVYTTGYFQGTADFDPGAGTSNMTSAGNKDIFVSKLDANGNFVWARKTGGTGDDHGQGVAVDSSGFVYIAGFFTLTADFDPGAGTINMISAAAEDVFVWKLDADGNFVWVSQFGGSALESGYGIAVGPSGSVYTTGEFYGTTDFDPGASISNLTPAGNSDVFVSKLDTAGNFVWCRQLGGAGSETGYAIAVDSVGNAHTTGSFNGTADFDPGAGTSIMTSPAGNNDVFVSKLDTAGNFVWARQLGGTSSEVGYGIAVDAVGNVHTTGLFSGTADFDPGAGTSNLTSAGGTDAFVSKLDSAGVLVWARQLGGTDTDVGNAIAVNSSGLVYTTGAFNGTADFDPGAGTINMTSAGGNDAFVSRLNAAGNFGLARQLSGIASQIGLGVAVDPVGNVYTTGSFSGTADFDPSASTINMTSAGSTDVYVSKLAGPDEYVSVVPGRLMDTRVPASPTVDGLFQAIGIRAAGSATELQITGRGGVPADAKAVVLNVTVTGALGGGFVTVYPCGSALPNASNLNFVAGQTIPNLVITQIGTGGKVCLYTSADIQLLVDLNGFYPASSAYAPIVPGRLMDTRVPASPTVDGLFQAIGARVAGSTTELQITGRGGVPADAEAVVLNITVTGAMGSGYVSVYPCGSPPPLVSNLNYVDGDTIPNLVITKVGAGGKVCVFTSAATNLIADLDGYYPAGSAYESLVPQRMTDSRPGGFGCSVASPATGIRSAGSTTELSVAGTCGVAADASAVVLNVTVAAAQATGFITVYPCGSALPNASNVNYLANQAIPNLVITKIGSAGKVCLFTSAATHLIVDVYGYYPPSPGAS